MRKVSSHAIICIQPAIVSGVNENAASLTVILSTYAHGTTKTGLTIQTKGAAHSPLCLV
jgi:hypothetical protein